MLLLSLLSYADRSVLAILSPTILGDLHMSATQYGYAVSAFSVCYMAANPCGGSGSTARAYGRRCWWRWGCGRWRAERTRS
jgi:MFS family permease